MVTAAAPQLTPAWTKLRYHQQQTRVWRSPARFKNIVAGRGSGKSELARRYEVRMLSVKKPWPDPLYFYALPTRAQARRVAWEPIRALIPDRYIKKIYLSDMRIVTVFGSELHVVGMDKPQRIEGNQWDGGILDESSDQKPRAFTLSILPALSHRDGFCWQIGVPKRYGPGAVTFRQYYELGLSGADGTESYSWPSSDILTPGKLEWARHNLDEADFEEQYNASWLSAGGQIFHAFDEKLNVRPCPYDPNETLIVGCDFNVDPMCWTLNQVHGDQFWTIGELFIRNCNTDAALKALQARFAAQHKADWWFVSDAAGQARHTSASHSDHIQIRQFAGITPKRVYSPSSNPRIVDRFAACNALLCNAAGKRRAFIDPKCTHLIMDFKVRAYKERTREPDDEGDVGHMSDAWGYPVFQFFPIRIASSGIAEARIK